MRDSDTHPATPFLLGICGGSASGKTTFAHALATELADLRVTVLSQDRYFRDFSEFPEAERERRRTHNHPDCVRWERLESDLAAIKTGDPVTPPTRKTNASIQASTSEIVPSDFDLIILEGHLIFHSEPIRGLLDLAVYLEADPHERVLRRIERHLKQDRMDLEKAIAWYRRDVTANYNRYTAPLKEYADFIIPTDRDAGNAMRFLAAGLQHLHS